jgi:hypothetical protein
MKITKFDVYLNIWVSLLISAVLSFALPMIANGHVAAAGYFSGLALSFIVSLILVLAIPLVKLGDMFAALCGTKPHTIPRQLLSTVVLALIIGTAMSLIMTWWGVRNIPGFQEFFLSAWLYAYPFALVILYVILNISLWTGVPLVKKLLGIPGGPLPTGKDGDR